MKKSRKMRILLSITACLLMPVFSSTASALVPHLKAAEIIAHTMEVRFSLSEHSMDAKDIITIRPQGRNELTFTLNDKATVTSVTSGGNEVYWSYAKQSMRDESRNPDRVVKVWLPGKGRPPDIVEIEIRYGLTVYDIPKVPSFSRELIADESKGLIGEEGIFLTPEGRWYPDMPGSTPSWRITATTPAGYETVAAGERIQRYESGGSLVTTWDFPYPADDFFLVAGKYQITEDRVGAIKIYTYFYPEEKDLVPAYIAAVKEYLELYQGLLGRYPFTKFAVVENFFPTGYGMPSFTLLGRDVIKLPFIVSTSLGHEIAHNWWGNSVYVDYESGNWAEGITTYTADHLYKERKSAAEAADYRRQINIDYTNYVTRGKDFPLTEFRGRTSPATRAVGYGKAAMVFHMLRRQLGDVKFNEGLRRLVIEYSFRQLNWKQIMKVFESSSGQGLAPYYYQWVQREGAPLLTAGEMQVKKKDDRKDDRYEVEIEVTQSGPGIKGTGGAYVLDLPVKIVHEEGELLETRPIHEVKTRLRFSTPAKPLKVILDPNYDIFRRLSRDEIPPVIGHVLGDEKQLFILPSGGTEESRAEYADMAWRLARGGGVLIKTDTDVAEKEWAGYSVVLFGGPDENRVFSKFEKALPKGASITGKAFEVTGKKYGNAGDFLLLTSRNPDNEEKGVMFLVGLSAQAISSAGKKITHYGKYSYLVFSDGNNKEKGVWDGNPGLFLK